MTRARDIANFGDGIATADIGDGQITTAKIADGDVTSAKLFSGFANGVTEADMWELTSSVSPTFAATTFYLTTNLSRISNSGFGYIGTGMSQSSGVFTFPTTGIYLVQFAGTFFRNAGTDRAVLSSIEVSTDGGSNFSQIGNGLDGLPNTASNNFGQATATAMIDVDDTANVKVRFGIAVYTSAATTLTEGDMTFVRLGDT